MNTNTVVFLFVLVAFILAIMSPTLPFGNGKRSALRQKALTVDDERFPLASQQDCQSILRSIGAGDLQADQEFVVASDTIGDILSVFFSKRNADLRARLFAGDIDAAVDSLAAAVKPTALLYRRQLHLFSASTAATVKYYSIVDGKAFNAAKEVISDSIDVFCFAKADKRLW